LHIGFAEFLLHDLIVTLDVLSNANPTRDAGNAFDLEFFTENRYRKIFVVFVHRQVRGALAPLLKII
jgi:hypothetical protein